MYSALLAAAVQKQHMRFEAHMNSAIEGRGGALPLQAGLRRRHTKASWAYLSRMIELLSSSS